MYWLSNSLSQLGLFEEVLVLCKERVELIQLKVSSVGEKACYAMGELGVCYMDLLRYAEATAVLKKQVEITRKIENQEHEAGAKYHLAAVGARDGSCNSYETIKVEGRLLEKCQDNDMKRVKMPHVQFFYGTQWSGMIQIGQWFNFRMYKKTGIMIEDGLPGLKQSLGACNCIERAREFYCGWFEDGGMPIAYTHPRGVHSDHSSRPGQGDNTRSVKLSLLLQTARLVYM